MKLKLLSAAATAILCASALFAASPAATQKWVQDYVATHGGASIAWVIDYVRTNLSETAATQASDALESQRREIAALLSAEIFAASSSGLYAQAANIQVSTNEVEFVKMAYANSGGWTNVVYGCGISTSLLHTATLTVGQDEYFCSAFTNYNESHDFILVLGEETNIITTSWVSITTNDYKIARGEN